MTVKIFKLTDVFTDEYKEADGYCLIYKKVRGIKMNLMPENGMCITAVSAVMEKLGYDWSNQAQVYVYKKPGFEYSLQPLSMEVAELIFHLYTNREKS